MRFGRERDDANTHTDESSSSSSSAPLREIDGFRFIRSLATARISTTDDYERARDRALALAAGAFITSAAVTAGVVARARSRPPLRRARRTRTKDASESARIEGRQGRQGFGRR